jgi:hypothetical protein
MQSVLKGTGQYRHQQQESWASLGEDGHEKKEAQVERQEERQDSAFNPFTRARTHMHIHTRAYACSSEGKKALA